MRLVPTNPVKIPSVAHPPAPKIVPASGAGSLPGRESAEGTTPEQVGTPAAPEGATPYRFSAGLGLRLRRPIEYKLPNLMAAP